MEIILDVLLKTAIIGPTVFIAFVAIWKLFIKNLFYRPTIKQIMEVQNNLWRNANLTDDQKEFYCAVATGDCRTVMKLWRKVHMSN